MNDAIRFLLNGARVDVDDSTTTLNLLTWLRERRGLTGTKEGCAEGDCGACTVVVAELDADSGLQLHSINACIQFLPALDGKAVFTVEYLRRQAGGGLHPVQQAMVAEHGSQCGFCTPGFVMSLWALYNEPDNETPPPERQIREEQVRNAITGNLCRCTGYRPIIAAGLRMREAPTLPLDREAIRDALLDLRRTRELDYVHAGQHFHAPQRLSELLALRAAKPAATLLAGCTDIGLWVNKQFRPLGDLILTREVAELKLIATQDGWLRIGAAVSLNRAFTALTDLYPALRELWLRFASEPVRNAGTLGGNVANGSPIGDAMPALIALGARIELQSATRIRQLPLEAFYLGYMKKDLGDDEVLVAIEAPLPTAALCFRSYKVSKRFDSDISAVCAAFAFQLEGETLRAVRIAYGGMAATPKRATKTEAALEGRQLDGSTLPGLVAAAQAALAQDFSPLSDMRASAAYRARVAANLVARCLHETRPDAPLPASMTSVFAPAASAPEDMP